MVKSKLALTFLGLCLFNLVSAQNTGGVFPPTVNEGHQSWQYRIGIDPDVNGETRAAQHLHYQQAINDDFMWRIVGQVRKTDDSDIDPDFLQAELFWELSKPNDNYQMGVRFDARVRDGSRPSQFGFNWIHQWKLSNDWRLRAILLTATQFGNDAPSGITLQTRAQLAHRLDSGVSVGLELFNSYGNAKNIGSFDEQNHTLGPMFSIPVSGKWSLFAGALFGVSDAAPGEQIRFWVTRSL